MNALAQTDWFFASAASWAWFLSQVIAGVLAVWASLDALSRPAEHFAAADKRSKNFWLGLNALGLAVLLISLLPLIRTLRSLLETGVSASGGFSMLMLLAVVANAVYLADVRPALDYYRPVRVRSQIRRPGRDGRGRGASGRRR